MRKTRFGRLEDFPQGSFSNIFLQDSDLDLNLESFQHNYDMWNKEIKLSDISSFLTIALDLFLWEYKEA